VDWQRPSVVVVVAVDTWQPSLLLVD
jgi:hypothetical protein